MQVMCGLSVCDSNAVGLIDLMRMGNTMPRSKGPKVARKLEIVRGNLDRLHDRRGFFAGLISVCLERYRSTVLLVCTVVTK